jgi:D-alanine-D-alanine ligase
MPEPDSDPGATKIKRTSSLYQKTLLVVNTGSTKKRFIFQRLKKLGLKVVVVNKEKNWAIPYVADWILVDTTQHQEVIKKVGAYLKKHHIDGVITFWDDDIQLAAKICDKFGFIGNSLEHARTSQNKYLLRKFCHEHDLPAPHHILLTSLEAVELAKKTLQFPIVIKPTYGASSAYVIKVETPDDLDGIHQQVVSSLSVEVESALTNGVDLVAEEYLEGEEVDIDLVIQNGKIKFSSVADNYGTKEPYFIETTHVLPSNLPEESQSALVGMAEEVLEKLGIQNCCVHFEAKMTAKGPFPLEVNLRMGGDAVQLMIYKTWKVDLIEAAVKVALGIYVKKIEAKKVHKHVVCQTFEAPHSGVLSSLHISEGIEKWPFIVEFYFGKDVGDKVYVPPDHYEYLGWVTVSGDSFLDVQENMQKALKAIRYEVVKFDESSMVGRTTRRTSASQASLDRKIWAGMPKQNGFSKIERLRQLSKADQRKLHVGIACNNYASKGDGVEVSLSAVGNTVQKVLHDRGYQTTYLDFNNLPSALDLLQHAKIDFVFNLCERINDSSLLEPHAAAIFDIFQMPYTGSNPFTLGLCIDKIRVKKLLTYHNIPTAKWDYAYSLDDEVRSDLRYPLIVKPANTDNSIGVTNDSVVTDIKGLKRQLDCVINTLHRPALIEEYIEGDEYDVSILGSEYDDLRVLPLSRTVFDDLPEGYWHIYPYESKYEAGGIYKKYLKVQRPPKKMSAKLQSLITEIALDTYNILDCHDYGRVEIKVDKDNNPYVLELNPNPSIDIGCCLPAVAELVGMNFGDFIEKIISLAIKRYKDRLPYDHLQGNII